MYVVVVGMCVHLHACMYLYMQAGVDLEILDGNFRW